MSLRKLFKPSRGVPYWMLRSWSMKPSVTNKAFLLRQTSEWSTSYIPCELYQHQPVWVSFKVFPLYFPYVQSQSSTLSDSFQTPGFNWRYCCPPWDVYFYLQLSVEQPITSISTRPDPAIFRTQSRCQILSAAVKKCGCCKRWWRR